MGYVNTYRTEEKEKEMGEEAITRHVLPPQPRHTKVGGVPEVKDIAGHESPGASKRNLKDLVKWS